MAGLRTALLLLLAGFLCVGCAIIEPEDTIDVYNQIDVTPAPEKPKGYSKTIWETSKVIIDGEVKYDEETGEDEFTGEYDVYLNFVQIQFLNDTDALVEELEFTYEVENGRVAMTDKAGTYTIYLKIVDDTLVLTFPDEHNTTIVLKYAKPVQPTPEPTATPYMELDRTTWIMIQADMERGDGSKIQTSEGVLTLASGDYESHFERWGLEDECTYYIYINDVTIEFLGTGKYMRGTIDGDLLSVNFQDLDNDMQGTLLFQLEQS